MTTPAIKTLGVPKETKTSEGRVALTPDGVRELERLGVEVFVETAAGLGASIEDRQYEAAGATIVPTAADAWSQQMVVKVKEPTAKEFDYLRPDLTLFTYLHLAAYPKVAEALLKNKTTSIAYETVQELDGSLPLLAPMSEIAGRIATQVGAFYLQSPNGGRGVLMGGAPGVHPAKVLVIGAGNVGWNSAWIAGGMEAEVALLDKNLDRLRFIDQIIRSRITTIASNRGAIERYIAQADRCCSCRWCARTHCRYRRHGQNNETWLSDCRRRRRPGWLHRNNPRNNSQRTRLRKTWRAALCRRQHAWRSASHKHLRTDERNFALSN